MFQTERLLLRPYKESDMPLIMALVNDARVQPFISLDYLAPLGSDYETSMRTAFSRTDKAVCFVLETLDTHEFVGTANAAFKSRKNREAEYGIMLEPRWWDRGFGGEVTRWMVDYAFKTLGMHRFSLHVFGSNERAISLYERMGFKVEGREKKANWSPAGKWEDIISMAILDEEWVARQCVEADGWEHVDVPSTIQT